MSETAQELVDRLVAAGGWPDPDSLQAILEHGAEAVGPLIAVVNSGTDADLDALSFAVDLLITLRNPEALPALIELARTDDLDILDVIDERLGDFGAMVIDPLLEIARDSSLIDYPRTSAASAAVSAAGDDAVYRSRVATALNDILADHIARAEATEAEARPDFLDGELISFLVSDLADLADPRSRPLIDSAFDKELVDLYIADRESVDNSFAKGGKWSVPERDPRKWLSEYREQYKYHLEGPVRRAGARDDYLFDSPAAGLEPYAPPPVVETIRNSGYRPGRNDPCWCGIGKKYKKCHWEADHAV